MSEPEHDAYTAPEGYYVPARRKPKDDNRYYEVLSEAAFQAGFSWEVVRNKWPNFQKAFHGFDIDRVARYGPDDVDRLLADKGIVRNGRKIEAAALSDRFGADRRGSGGGCIR